MTSSRYAAEADDLHVAIRSSFDAAERQLEDYVRLRRGDVKTHEEPLRGRVARVFPDEGYGFIETAEGREVYFHERAVRQGRFAELRPGDTVTFGEELGEEGPQANFVAPD
jgi:cold shock CspA family protein